MSNIKNELTKVVTETLLPETEDYLEELHSQYENNTLLDEDKEVIRDMESFLVELQNILLLIEENKITDEEAQNVYDKIIAMLNEHIPENHKG